MVRYYFTSVTLCKRSLREDTLNDYLSNILLQTLDVSFLLYVKNLLKLVQKSQQSCLLIIHIGSIKPHANNCQ